jgi:hypothetical protein
MTASGLEVILDTQSASKWLLSAKSSVLKSNTAADLWITMASLQEV